MVNECGEVTYCGGSCGLGSCDDDGAYDVVVAGNNHIYVVGHQCYTSGGTYGCWLTIWHLNPDGVLIDTATHSATEGWPSDYKHTRALAAGISNDHLFVVGATEKSNNRYGFLARYDLKGANEPPGPLALVIHEAPSVFLDLAVEPAGTSWLGGGVIAVGYTDPWGPGFPAARDALAVRYKAPNPTSFTKHPNWNDGASFGPYTSTGEAGVEDQATSVALISNKQIIISGFTKASGANGNAVDPYMVAMHHSSGVFSSGITFSSLYDRRPYGMLLDVKEAGKPFHGFVVGQHTTGLGEYPWLAEFAFTMAADETQTVSFSQPSFQWVDESTTGTALDVCWRGPELVVVGSSDVEATEHLVGTVYGFDYDPGGGYALSYSQQMSIDAKADTEVKGAIRACPDVFAGGPDELPSTILVGDAHQSESGSAGQDAVIARMSGDGAGMEIVCAGEPIP